MAATDDEDVKALIDQPVGLEHEARRRLQVAPLLQLREILGPPGTRRPAGAMTSLITASSKSTKQLPRNKLPSYTCLASDPASAWSTLRAACLRRRSFCNFIMLSTDFTYEPAGDARAHELLTDHAFSPRQPRQR